MGVVNQGSMFPTKLTNELVNLVRGKSSLAKLSNQAPISFNGNTVMTFSMDKEVDLVEEGGTKSEGGATITPLIIKPVKVEYSARFSDEFKYAAEEERLEYLREFINGFSEKLARGFDIMAMHGINPRSETASSLVGSNHFDTAVPSTNVVVKTTSPNTDVEDAIGKVMEAEHEVTGMAMSPSFRSALAAQTRIDGTPMFPELAWGQGGNDKIRGLSVDTNATVSKGSTNDLAIVGNFRDFFRWGIAREIPTRMIEFGNPDNSSLGDLASRNQILLRAEAYIGWGILVPEAFALIQGE